MSGSKRRPNRNRPAAAKVSGAMTEMPRPTTANPASAAHASGATHTSRKPSTAQTAATRAISTPPNRSVSLSPEKRPIISGTE